MYAWGFGMDGQLGLGSVVMATRPRRLRHSFLEERASSVACGDVFSAVVTGKSCVYDVIMACGDAFSAVVTGKSCLYDDIITVVIVVVVVNVIIVITIVFTTTTNGCLRLGMLTSSSTSLSSPPFQS